jgi:S-adenosylhomocysteine hydrolase
MLLNYYQRKAILENSGHSEEEIKRARRQAERSKRQRNTTKEMVQFMRVKDAVQSVGRTTKRALKKSNSTESLME